MASNLRNPLRAYAQAFAALRQDFYPDESTPRALVRETGNRARVLVTLPRDIFDLAVTGRMSGRAWTAWFKHRALDVIHPYGNQRA